MSKKIVVLDYGSGNVNSVVRAFKSLGATVDLTSNHQTVLEAEGLVLPGVGAYEAVMRQLEKVNAPFLLGRRIAGGRPVLGICVGMQVMFDQGIEHGMRTNGLGQWPGTVERLEASVVPHMGWNTVEPPSETRLFLGVEEERFYFVHSYGVNHWSYQATSLLLAPPSVTWTDYSGRFISAVENGVLSATQFHPEKSGDAGMTLLKNWIATL